MAWLSDGEQNLMIRLFVFTQLTNVTDGQTDRQTPHDDIGRACIASRGDELRCGSMRQVAARVARVFAFLNVPVAQTTVFIYVL